MPEPPEILFETATPQQILGRLDLIREQYRMGLLDVAAFNAVLKEFQFADDAGTLWTPGAQSNQWYRWERGQWVAAAPPAQLNLTLPVQLFKDFDETPESRASSAPAAAAAPAPAPARSQPAPSQPIAPAPVVAPPPVGASSQPKFCPQCGAPAAGKKFCSKCGRKLA